MPTTQVSLSDDQEGANSYAATYFMVLVAGLLYVLAVWFRPYWQNLLGVPSPMTVAYLREHSSRVSVTWLVLRLPAMACLAVASAKCRELRVAAIDTPRLVIFGAAVGGAATFVLGFTQIWPWTWTFPGNPGKIYTYVILEQSQWSHIATLFLMGSFIDPFIEEVMFRFSVLRIALAKTGNAGVAVIVSSIAFAVVHLGPAFNLTSYIVWHSLWIFILSNILGWMTLRRRGHISVAWAVHGAVNAVNLASLIFFVAIAN